jgi:hypothetical protein
MTVRVNPSPYARPLTFSYASDNLRLNGTNEVTAAQAWLDACATTDKVAVLDGTLSISSQLKLKGSIIGLIKGKIVNLALNDGTTYLVFYDRDSSNPSTPNRVVIEDLTIDCGDLNCNGFKAWDSNGTDTDSFNRSVLRNLRVTNCNGPYGIYIHGWINTVDALKCDYSDCSTAMIYLEAFNACVVNGINAEQSNGNGVGIVVKTSSSVTLNGVCVEGIQGEAFLIDGCRDVFVPAPYFEQVTDGTTAGDRIIGRIGTTSTCFGITMTDVEYTNESASSEFGSTSQSGDRIYVHYAKNTRVSGMAQVELTDYAVDCEVEWVRGAVFEESGVAERTRAIWPVGTTGLAHQPKMGRNIARDPFFANAGNDYTVTLTGIDSLAISTNRYPGARSTALKANITSGVTTAKITFDFSAHPRMLDLVHAWVTAAAKYFIPSSATYFDGSAGRIPYIQIEATYSGPTTYTSPKIVTANYTLAKWCNMSSSLMLPSGTITNLKVIFSILDSAGSAIGAGVNVDFTAFFFGKRPLRVIDASKDAWHADHLFDETPWHPGYVANRWYASKYISGIGTTTATADRIYYVPFPLYGHANINTLAFSMATPGGANSLARMGVYTDSNGRPGSLIRELSAEIDITSGGSPSGSFSTNVPAGPRMVWIAVLFKTNGTMAIFNRGSGSESSWLVGAGGASDAMGNSAQGGFYETYSYAALPSTVGSLTAAITVPIVCFKAA